jgi:hypothetical protein
VKCVNLPLTRFGGVTVPISVVITRHLAAGYIKTHIRLDAGVEISLLRAGTFLQNYYATH